MTLYIWKYNLKIPYSQVSRISYNYKEEKKMFPNLLNLSWLTTSKFSFYGELPTLTFWELKPNSAWGSLTLLDEVLLNNLNYCKAWLAWHNTAERWNSEGQSQSSGCWRSQDAVTELEVSQTCLHYSDMEVRNAALRSHVLRPTLQRGWEKVNPAALMHHLQCTTTR